MQHALPKGEGGMLAVLGENIDQINRILKDNNNKFECFIANDNTIGQIVVSGKVVSFEALGNELKNKNIKFIKLPVSAIFIVL